MKSPWCVIGAQEMLAQQRIKAALTQIPRYAVPVSRAAPPSPTQLMPPGLGPWPSPLAMRVTPKRREKHLG